MPLKATCPNCSAKLNVKDSLAGKTLPCPQCKQAFTIPLASPAPAAPPAPPALPAAKGPPVKKAELAPLDDDLEVIDDFESDLMPLPSKKKKPPKPQPVEPELATADADEAAQSGSGTSPLWLFVGIGSVGSLFVGAVIGYFVFASSKSDASLTVASGTADSGDTSSAAPLSVPKLTPEQKTIARDLKTVLSRMEGSLKEGSEKEFFTNFAPMEELRKFQQADSSSEESPKIPRDSLRVALQSIAGQEPQFDTSGLTAAWRKRIEGPRNDRWSPGPGYEGDVMAAIKAGIDDLNQGNTKDFIRNMFPPDALQVMFQNGADHSPVSLINKDAAIVALMLQDLKLLQALTPKIEQDVAEFTLPPVAYEDRWDQISVRPGADGVPLPDRVIRFSRIKDRWRFYDDGSLRKSGALDVTETILRMERIGDAWRLASYP